MHINLNKPNHMPSVTVGCVVITQCRTTSLLKHYLIIKHNTTYSALKLENYKVCYANLPTPEDILTGITLNNKVIEVLSPEQTILSRKDGN